MTDARAAVEKEFNAWNPGLESSIPAQLMPKVTLFRPENSSVDYRTAKEIAEFCGLDPADAVAFTTERLVIHELLIRVTADLYVQDGPNYEDLGINLRAMVDTIYRDYILPRIDFIRDVHARVLADIEEKVSAELDVLYAPAAPPPAPSEKKGFLSSLFGGSTEPADPTLTQPAKTELEAIEDWSQRLAQASDPLDRACLSALGRVVGSMYGKRGRLVGDRDLVRDLVTRMAGNGYGSAQIGKAIEGYVTEAVEAENYRILPAQEKPVIMNVKGASAAGKSTIRSDQMRLAKKLGIPWETFAVISPDYWRKYMLDYDSMGGDYKYAAMLTGQELAIIDKKLDQYMAKKAASKKMTHLLIDRFRFDSFRPGDEGAADSNLLTRFGDLVFMFFVITAPAATVERAWLRGLTTGRYKAVDDLLHHNVEAYTGMPELFFSWALTKGRRIHYEFLDNNVREDERPRTIAFGWNDEMTVLDVKCMLDIDRYRKVNLKARRPEDVMVSKAETNGDNTVFLKRCADLMHKLRFADFETGRIYGEMEAGSWIWRDPSALDGVAERDAALTGLTALGWDDCGARTERPTPESLEDERAYTLGAWAPATRQSTLK